MTLKRAAALIILLALLTCTAAPAFAEHQSGGDVEFRYQERYRNAVVNNSLIFYKKMHNDKVAFGRFMADQQYNTRYWEPVYLQGHRFWKVRDDVSKADALNDAIDPKGGRYKIDCSAAINLIVLKSKMDVVGEEKFNKRLPSLILNGWNTFTEKNGQVEKYQSLEIWKGTQYMPGSVDDLEIGDYAYFKNHPMMEGTAEQGENAIYLGLNSRGQPVFFGLNIGIFSGLFNEYGFLSSERGSVDPKALKEMAEL